MIGKAGTGNGFRGLVNYLYQEKDGDRVEWSVGLNLITTEVATLWWTVYHQCYLCHNFRLPTL
jgi:hypothetical protein